MDSVLVFNLNKTKIDNWVWRTMPESTEFGRKSFVYKYITFLDYSKGKVVIYLISVLNDLA